MPLQKTPLQINFARGLDQKTDPLQVQPGRFLGLKNRVFNKMGRLEKRNGYGAKGQSVITPSGLYSFSKIPGTVAAGRNVSAYASELTLNDGLNFYSYASGGNDWIYKGRVELCQTEESSVYKNQFNNIMPDSAYNSTLGLYVYAWESWTAPPFQVGSATLNGVQVAVVDSTNGQTLFTGYLANTTSRPKCISISGSLYVLYYNSADSKIYAQSVTQSGFGAAVALITNAATVPNYDALVNNGLLYIGYSGTGSTTKVASFNSSMSAIASASKAEVSSNGVGLFADTSNNIWVAYNNGSATKAFILDSTLASTVLAATTIDSSSAAANVQNVTGIYDGTRGVIFYDKPGGPKLGQPFGNGANIYMSDSFVQPAVGSTVSANFTGSTSSLGFQYFQHNNAVIYIPTGGYYFVTGAIVGSVGATIANLGLAGSASPGATVASSRQIVYPTAGFQNAITTYGTLTAGGSVGSTSTFMRSAYLAGKAFMVNSVPHVVVGFDSTLQSTYFTAALYNVNALSPLPPGVCVAKVGESLGGGPPYRSVLPAVNSVSSGVVQFAFPERSVELLRTSNNTSAATFFLGVGSAQVDFATDDIQTLDLGRNLQIASGVNHIYDGATTSELGYNYYPETVTAVGYAGDGGLTAGTYGYQVVYEWIDNLGQKHRSAPSPTLSYPIGTPPVSFTANTTNTLSTLTAVSSLSGLQVGQKLSGIGIAADTYISSIDSSSQITMSKPATATGAAVTITPSAVSAITLTIPTLRITEKNNATIAIYRTAVNGTFYTRVDTQYISYPIANTTAADTITFTDFSSDSDISGNEQLYTESEVENIAPPAALAIAEYKNRQILVPSGDPYSWWYSKQVVNGSPVEFSDIFQKNMGTQGGPLVGAAKLDDKLILFKQNSIFYVTGTGPSPNGANDDFADPQFITADAGLLSPRSIVTTPVGLMFKSAKGIYLLDRSLQTRYIGKAVEDFNQYTVRGAQLIPKSNQVRFILSNGQCLMYDYYWTDEEGIGQWAVFDPVSAVSDCLFQDLHTYVTSAGLVYQETPGVYLDGGAGISTYFLTGWFNLSGLQGLERFYYFTLLAQYISSHSLSVNLYYNYDSNTAYPVPTITPSATELEQWRIFPTIQKVQSFQIELTESGATGAGLTMSGLDMLVGVKRGTPTIKAANSAG